MIHSFFIYLYIHTHIYIHTNVDKNGDGTIASTEVGTVLRSLGSNPTEEDLGKIVADINATKGGKVDFAGFQAILDSRKGDVDSELEITEALNIFDKDGVGAVSVPELTHILTNIGEKMGDDEVSEILREVAVDSQGMVKIADLVKLFFAK